MQANRLQQLFKPESIALFGASSVPEALGTVVLNNLKSGGFSGTLTLINPKNQEIDGQPCYSKLSDARSVVDTAIIVAPPAAVPEIITDCGESGAGAAIVISAGFSEAGAQGKTLETEMLRRAERYESPIDPDQTLILES